MNTVQVSFSFKFCFFFSSIFRNNISHQTHIGQHLIVCYLTSRWMTLNAWNFKSHNIYSNGMTKGVTLKFYLCTQSVKGLNIQLERFWTLWERDLKTIVLSAGILTPSALPVCKWPSWETLAGSKLEAVMQNGKKARICHLSSGRCWSGLTVRRQKRRMNVLKDQGGQWQCGIWGETEFATFR